MMDPLRKKILAALDGPLNPQTFERCAVNLLRDAFPALVPVSGGNDAGMDGAIADGEAEPFPLVCTTEKDVLGNLTRSLDSYLKKGGTRKRVVLATSQALTARRRFNLEERAREKGFVLVQSFEREGIAARLQQNPSWCKELLGFSGRLSALSTVPLTRRPLLEIEPVGREDDLEWLRTTRGDRILSGEPGSGKTFLLYHLARQGWGLFLVEDDRKKIEDALLEQEPKVVFVDDAHVDPGRLVRLRQIREENKTDFEIVATTWKWAEGEIAEALGSLPASQVHRLELLTREEIKQLYEKAGLRVADDTMRLLIDQAANKPGLAITLAQLWQRGEWQGVLDGSALSRSLLTVFQNLVGPESADLLAAFSLGEDGGMTLAAVGDFLKLPPHALRQKTAALSAAGVLFERGNEILAVRPHQLRSALLRHVFFDPIRLEYQTLLQRAPNYSRAVEALLLAKAQGAAVPPGELRELVRRAEPRAWQWLAGLDEESSRWVLENYRGDLLEIAPAALQHAPAEVVPRLLKTAERATARKPAERYLSVLSEWVQDLRGRAEGQIRKRLLVAHAAQKYLQNGGDPGIGASAICSALSPILAGSSLDPAEGKTVTLYKGLVSPETLREIGAIWETVKTDLDLSKPETLHHLSAVLWHWIFPKAATMGASVSAEVEQAMRGFAEKVLRDMAPRAIAHPGLAAALAKLAARLGVEIPLASDPIFDLLNVRQGYDQEELQRKSKALRDLARQWSARPPTEVAGQLAFYERERAFLGPGWAYELPVLCRELAATAEQPEIWLEAFWTERLPGLTLDPFLERVARQARPGWESWIERCLEDDLYTGVALGLVLVLPSPSAPILERALARSSPFHQLIETLCLRNEVPLDTLTVLLRHRALAIALAAAVGEWLANPEGEVRPEVSAPWREVILRTGPKEDCDLDVSQDLTYWLGVILARDKALAFDWLRARLHDGSYLLDEPSTDALSGLDVDQRSRLLEELAPPEDESIPDALIQGLIGKDPMLYRKFLASQALSNFHLEPLAGMPDELWAERAALALGAGYPALEVARAAFRAVESYWGSGIEYWTQWDEAFAALESHGEKGIREVAAHGRRLAQARMREATKEAKKQAIHGR